MSATDRKPKHSKLNRFRNDLIKAELHESIFEAINSQLLKHLLMTDENEEDLLVIYATVVEAVACPRKTYTVIAEGRKEGERSKKS